MRQSYNFKFFLLITLGLIFNQSWSQVTTFSYTGSMQTYVVPLGVTSLEMDLFGGAGHGNLGLGGRCKAVLDVTPGETLNIYVGGAGTGTSGGFNGGGNPGGLSTYGGGGGASDVRQGGTTLGDRIIVAGGGGGSGSNCGTWTAEGGHGGGLTGQSGCLYSCSSCQYTGGGGSQVAGGIAGPTGHGSCGGNSNGTLGNGGSNTVGNYGTGGGGGYYGGGSGCFEGAGGGSSYTDGGATEIVHTQGARSGNGEIIITVLCTPLTVAAHATEFCFGDELTLDATSDLGGSISWDGGVTNGAAFAPPVGVTTYTATSDADGDCGFQVDILTHDLPSVTASVDDDEVCDGEVFTFTGGGATSYTWDLGVTNGVAFTAAVGTATYTVTGTDANGCENTATVDATVHNLPTVTASVDDDEVCDGEAFTFTGGGAATYTWDSGVTDGVAFTAAIGTATYTVTGTDANGCENTATVDATVHNLPTVTASVDDDEVCDGEAFTFTGGGAATYTWDLGVTNGVAFTAAVGTATYTVTGTDANGCENTATVDATVHNLPTVIASVDDDEVCDGEAFTFTGGGAATYTWDSGVTDGVAFTATIGTATYTVTGTDANGCENSASIDATVHDIPTVTASVDDDEVCDGEAFTFTGGGAATYTWDLGVTDGVAFTAAVGTATYTVTGTDANGCENTATVDATVHNLPTVTASVDDDEVCDGEAFTFTGGGAVTYSWDLGVTDGIAFTAAVGTATYTVTGTDVNGCENSATIDATVYGLPTVIATAADDEVCDGEEITLTGEGATDYDWDMDVTDGEAFTQEVGTETYTVTGTDDNGCENTAEIDITVNELPTVTATASETEVCYGSEVTFAGGGATSYDWDMGVTDGEPVTMDTEGTLTFTVVGTDDNGCQNTASINVDVADEIVVTYTTGDELMGTDGDIDISVSGGVAPYTFDWDNDGTGDFDDDEDLNDLPAGEYTVTVQDSNGCTTTIEITVDSQVGINEANEITLNVYPNPTTGLVTVEFDGRFTYALTNINGAVITQATAIDKEIISLENVARGVYFVMIRSNDTTHTVKVVKK